LYTRLLTAVAGVRLWSCTFAINRTIRGQTITLSVISRIESVLKSHLERLLNHNIPSHFE